MGHKGNMRKVGKSSKKMYGAKRLLVCGYQEPEQQEFLLLLKEHKLTTFPVIFATNNDIQKPLKEVLEADDRCGLGEMVDMQRAVIMSGFTQKELHLLMTAYRKAKLPTQHWAALTPVSEKWTVNALLDELAAEAQAIKNQRK